MLQGIEAGTEETPVLAVTGLSKAFGPTRALSTVDLAVKRGEIHGLVGHNGSGKSTLVKILAGYHERDEGSITVLGRELPTRLSTARVRELGIGFVHQDLALVPQMSIADNIGFSARGFARAGGKRIDWRKHAERVAALTGRLGLRVDPSTLVADLSPAEQTLVAIARSLGEYDHETLLVLDEPTARLPQREVGRLLAALRALADGGAGILYISHRLDEVLSVCHRITVFRDGRSVVTVLASEQTHDSLIRLMTGGIGLSELSEVTQAELAGQVEEDVLVLEDIHSGPLHSLDLRLRRGEVLVLTGAVGAGTENVARVVYGMERPARGRVLLDGRPVDSMDPFKARTLGIAYVPADRKGRAGFPELTVNDNIHALGSGDLPSLRYSSRGRIQAESERLTTELRVRPRDPRVVFETLSGGNQQKVLTGKWLRTRPRVLVVEEPTQGVDVTSRAELYALVRHATAEGLSVLWLTTDLEEVPIVADRALVLHRGRIVARFQRGDIPVHALTKAVLAGAVA